MAIDTAAKRARALNAATPSFYATGPVPDGSADRPFVLHLYFDTSAAMTEGTRQNRRAARRRRRC